VDDAGNCYVAEVNEAGGNVGDVVRITPAGASTTLASGLSGPNDVCSTADGTIQYVCDTGNNKVKKIQGGTVTQFGSYAWNSPAGIDVDAAGNVYVCEGGTGQVVKLDPSGSTAVVLATGLGLVVSAQVNPADGNVYSLDYTSGVVYKFPTSPGAKSTFKTGLYGNSIGLSIDATGRIYISETILNKIGRMPYTNASGYAYVAGAGGANGSHDDPNPLLATFNQPGGLRVARNTGWLYIADQYNNKIRILK
jgi:sugar lactone lactonase YvrE